MSALISNLLMYSQVDTGKRSFAPTETLRALHGVLNDLKKVVEDTHSIITFDTLPVITADEIQMAQLFQNLIGNAIKFRSEQPVIHISAARGENEWLFSVKDNGIGFDMRYADSIFDSFQRLNSASEYPGAGLGLAICKKIVERHGGRIWATSVLGKGTVFYFTIPDREETGGSK
jgi:chemotaxis family two-component system sensor kinase Cph1